MSLLRHHQLLMSSRKFRYVYVNLAATSFGSGPPAAITIGPFDPSDVLEFEKPSVSQDGNMSWDGYSYWPEPDRWDNSFYVDAGGGRLLTVTPNLEFYDSEGSALAGLQSYISTKGPGISGYQYYSVYSIDTNPEDNQKGLSLRVKVWAAEFYPAPADPDFTKTSLLALMGGGDGATTFVDSSSYDHALTRGSPAVETTAETKFGRSVLNVTGAGGYVRAANHPAFQFGSSDFTVEAWVYRGAGSASDRAIATLWSGGSTLSWYMGVSTSGQLFFYYSTNGTTVASYAATGGSVPTGRWSHVAACRSGATLRLFINGVVVATTNIGSAALSNGGAVPLTIGNQSGSSVTNQWWLGYIGSVRIKKGEALYTGRFPTPAVAFPAG